MGMMFFAKHDAAMKTWRKTIAAKGAALFAATALALHLSAADYTCTWTEGVNPESLLDGKLAFTYQVIEGVTRIHTINVSASAGDTVTITGDKMRFVNSDDYKQTTIVIPNKCKLVFQNEVEARTLRIENATGSTGKYRTWCGYEEFLDTNWRTVFEDAKLDDAELVMSKQFQYKSADTTVEVPAWDNRNMNMHPHHVKRRPGFLSCRYQGYWDRSYGYVVCIPAEFRQNGDDIEMRILDACRIRPSDGSAVFLGMDADSMCGRYTRENRVMRTTGVENSGYGMNTVKLSIREAVCRFENEVTFAGSPDPREGVRLEFADVSKFGNTAFFVGGTDSEVVFRDGSKVASGWKSSAGDGTFLFETTKPTASPDVTNRVVLSNTFGRSGTFRVRGIEGYPMILRTMNADAFPTKGGGVIVESNGILEIGKGGNNVSDGVVGGKPLSITVNKGGILRQCNRFVFGTNLTLTVNGGTIEFGVKADGIELGDTNAKLDTDLYQITLRDGAKLVSMPNFAPWIGRWPYSSWVVGGDSPSTNAALIRFMSYGQFGISTNTFNIAKVGDGSYDADFVTTGKILEYGGSAPWKTNVLRKVGLGTFRFDATYNVPGSVELEQGCIMFGVNDVWGSNKPTLNFRGGTLLATAGTSNTMGPVTLYDDSAITVESGAVLEFPYPSPVPWTEGKTLDITMPRTVSGYGATVRFAALTDAQLAQIRVNGRPVNLDNTGRVIPLGLSIVIR